ncbi:MAG: GntR family transcriptional regulator [Clostridiaceae bacterium]
MNIVVSFYSKEPMYEQILNQIKELILTGKLEANEQLPSIRQLAKDLKVSVTTVKKAYEELERQGIIATLHGRGSFITDINIDEIKEKNIKTVTEKLKEIKDFSIVCGIEKEELKNIIDKLYEGE